MNTPNMQTKTAVLFASSLILIAALSRVFPHPPNFSPVATIALFGGIYLKGWHRFAIPFAAMVFSDIILGYHTTIAFVYGSFALTVLLGTWLQHRNSLLNIGIATVTSSVLFFIITNFGVWATQQVTYPPTFDGLVQCYIAAIPFFRNTLIGDLVYVGLLVGIYEFTAKKIRQFSLSGN